MKLWERSVGKESRTRRRFRKSDHAMLLSWNVQYPSSDFGDFEVLVLATWQLALPAVRNLNIKKKKSGHLHYRLLILLRLEGFVCTRNVFKCRLTHFFFSSSSSVDCWTSSGRHLPNVWSTGLQGNICTNFSFKKIVLRYWSCLFLPTDDSSHQLTGRNTN